MQQYNNLNGTAWNRWRHQLKQLIMEPVWNLEPQLKYLTESDQMDRTQPRNLNMWSVPPTKAINIGTSMRSGTVN